MLFRWRWLSLLVLSFASACGGGSHGDPSPSGRSTSTASAAPTAAIASASASATRGPLDAPSLMADVRWLSSPDLHGRGSATADEARAGDRLERALDDDGIARVGKKSLRTQAFDAMRPDASFGDGAHVDHASRNVMGMVPATNPRFGDAVVVLGAHYDHLGERNGQTYWGADDNASGTAAVLGIARSLMKRRGELGRTVVVVFFGAEEIGMRGSEAFVAQGPIATSTIFAMVNVDMIGRPLSDQPLLRAAERVVGIDPEASVGVDGLRSRPGFERVVRAACKAESHVAVTIDDLPESLRSSVEELSRGRGDNYSFEARGVPAIFFSSAESTDYHEPTDTPDTLSPELLEKRARIIERTIIGLSNLEAVRQPPAAHP